MQDIPNKAFTHGGKFHADEVMATAVLRILNPELKVQRGFKIPQGFDGIIYDIGFGEFDHHQKDSEKRPNGVPYAAFGLIWRKYGRDVMQKYCPEQFAAEEAERFDEKVIQHIDKDDNTGCGDIIGDLIGAFNPAWDSSKTDNECFWEAEKFAETILRNKLGAIAANYRARETVKKALSEMSPDGIVTLDVYAPWKMFLVPSPANFVVYPSQRGGFSAQCVPNDDDTHSLKIPFPQEWAGLDEEQLKQKSGIESIRFCHNSGFLISANTKQDAIAACRKAMQLAGKL